MTTAEALAVVREALDAVPGTTVDQPSFVKKQDALAALTFIEQRLGEADQELEAKRESVEAVWELHKAAQERAEKAEAERDEYAQQWAEVEEALHNYWFSQKSMTAGNAVRKLLDERDELKQRATENWDSYENANRRIEELEAALRDVAEGGDQWCGNECPEVARRALGSKKLTWAERCPACKGYKDQEHRYDLTCDEKVE